MVETEFKLVGQKEGSRPKEVVIRFDSRDPGRTLGFQSDLMSVGLECRTLGSVEKRVSCPYLSTKSSYWSFIGFLSRCTRLDLGPRVSGHGFRTYSFDVPLLF